jgi:tetratricopeptide (TPR) repeat protein
MVMLPLMLSMSTVALAQDDDGMSFGVDEVETPAEASPVAEFLEEGKKLYKADKFAEASLLIYKVISAVDNGDVGAEALLPEAEYELGKALFRLELYQGALTYFGRVVDMGDAHPYYLPTLRGLVLLTEVIPSDQTLLARLAPYASNFPQDVPKKYRDQYAYLVGRYLYSVGEYEKALELLNYIKPSSKEYLNARYIMGVTHVGNYDAKNAVAAFKDVLRPLTGKLADDDLEPEERQLLELTWLGMARVFYSVGEYNKAIKYYSLIPRKSPVWPKALFESSWAYFQLDKANKALGNLHTINSPFFARSYFPEAPILSGVIFFYNCKYARVRYELEEFEFTYLPIKDELEQVIADNQDPGKMVEWLRDLQSGKSSADEKITRILAASLDDKQIQRKLKLIEATSVELGKIEKLPSTWKSSALGGALVQDATVAREFAINELGELVQSRLKRVRDQIVDLNVNRERILFEVERAERGEIEAEMRAEMQLDSNVTGAKRVAVTDEELYWTFDGEYWKDELGYYFFTVNTECKR